MLSKSLIAASAGLVGSAHAFWRMECPGRVGLARLDPIVDFGDVSAHAHSVFGSSGFSKVADTAALLDGDCTSCRVRQDKSSYWTPTMYFKDAKTGEYEHVDEVGGMLAYYLLNNDDIEAFPADFQMIAGDNKRRKFTAGDPTQGDPDKSSWASTGQVTQDKLSQRALGFNCLNYAKDPEGTLYRHFMPDKDFLDANCKDGLRLELMFPSCWDGKNAKSEDHKSHVAYPDLVMNGNCPDSHPVALPGLLFETIVQTNAFEDRDGMFVFSNGDPTGFAYHGDFMMGWETDFLQEAVDKCTNPSGRIDDCPIFDVFGEPEARECEFKTPISLLADKVMEGLKVLPGDVEITYEDGPAEDDDKASEPPKPTKPYQPGGKPSDPSKPLPGQVFKDTSSVYVPKPTSTTPVVVEAAAIPSSTIPTTTTTPTPTTTPIDPNIVWDRTEYITAGNMVTKILWDEEVVWVTELVDSAQTVTIEGGAPSPAPEAEGVPAPVPVPEPAAEAAAPVPEAVEPVPEVPAQRKRAHLHNHARHH